VHLVPHTHDDVGWLDTVDGYYNNQVSHILDTTIAMLIKNPERKFVYVEMAFFKLWWDKQTAEMKDAVRKLVDNKQFEIINGGWSMNDEACPYYEEIIDNMQTGIEWINKELGFSSYIGWHLDPFGHSSTNARIQAKLGFDTIVFSRMNENDRNQRKHDQTLRTVWTPHNREKILAESLVSNYCDPQWMYNFDGDTDVVKQATDFYNYLMVTQDYYKKKTMIQLLGCDFAYQDGQKTYDNHKKAIDYLKSNPDKFPSIEFKYSLATEYLNDLKASGEIMSTKTDDYWNYGERGDSYWSGYFTSRPKMKYLTRYTGKAFQATRQLLSFRLMQASPETRKQMATQFYNEAIDFINIQIGVTQHHDAVSGTAKQFVTEDYYKRLNEALDYMTKTTAKLFQDDFKAIVGEANVPAALEFCDLQDPYANDCISKSITEKSSVMVYIYNPSANNKKLHKILVTDENVTVLNANNKPLDAEVYCYDMSTANQCYMYFGDDEMKAFDSNYYLIKYDKAHKNTTKIEVNECSSKTTDTDSCSLKTQGYGQEFKTIFYSDNAGYISFRDTEGVEEMHRVKVEYKFYQSMANNGQNSGAYIFRPDQATFFDPMYYTTFKKFTVGQGNLISIARFEGEASWQGGEKVNFNVAFNHYENSANKNSLTMTIEPEVGPVPTEDGIGREVVQIITNEQIGNEGVFYTDSNGLDMQKRVYGKAETFEIQPDKYDTIPASYYPVNGVIYIQDKKTRMTLLTEKTEGGVSRYNGMIETMVHRRTVEDDSRGVGEPLNEQGPDSKGLRVRPQYHLILENSTSVSDETARVRNNNIDYRPLVMFGSVNNVQKFLTTPKQDNTTFDLPTGLKFFLDYRSDGDYYLMRFHNISEKTFNLTKDQLVSILKQGSKNANISYEIQEMSTSNIETMSVMQARKFDWKTEESIKALN